MSVSFEHAAYVLAVHDAERSARHYIDVLGFEPIPIDAPGWRFVERGAVRIDLGECPDQPPASSLGDHSWFARVFVEGIHDYHAELVRRGGDVISAPEQKPWGLIEMAVRTIDGHRIMFCEMVERY